MKVAILFLQEWLPWVLAGVPAFIALALPGLLPAGDLRSSGQMTLFAVTPASFFVLLFIKRPWLARTVAIRLIGTTSLLVLAVLASGAAVAGTPDFLKEQFGLFISVDDYGPRAVITTPDGFVVVGDNAEGDAVVWLSADSQSWTRVPYSEALNGLEIGDAAYTEFGIVMVGQDEESKIVALTSADGAQWLRMASFGDNESDPAGKPDALAHSGPNLVLIGGTYQNDSAFWYADGPGTWSLGDPAPVFDEGKEAADVIAFEGGFIAATNRSRAGVVRNTYDGAHLFTSKTGQTWSEITHFREAEITSLVKYDQGVVAVGFDRAQQAAAIWVSTHGASWTQLSVTDALRGGRMDVVVANGARLFAFGRSVDDNAALVWSSSDTITWERVNVSFGDVVVRHAVMTDSGIVAVGVDLRSNYAAFWTSPDGKLWRRVVPHDNALFLVR